MFARLRIWEKSCNFARCLWGAACVLPVRCLVITYPTTPYNILCILSRDFKINPK